MQILSIATFLEILLKLKQLYSIYEIVSILLPIQHCQLITEHPDISNNKEILLSYFAHIKTSTFTYFSTCVFY